MTGRVPLKPLAEFPSDAWEIFSKRFSEARCQRMIDVVRKRSNWLRLVVQDVHHPHNVSACLRSADAFGVSRVDIVTMREGFRPTGSSRGVEHWLSLKRYFDIAECARDLRSQGYRIAVAYPSEQYNVRNVPIHEPLAVVFGNEHDGADRAWHELADYRFAIPMYGMVESLNVSVSCALTLSELRLRAEAEVKPEHFYHSEDEQKLLLNEWSCRQVFEYQKELDRRRQQLLEAAKN
jgi:tRNA (guanosine-2'-O-)-methyltransferase